uniref:Serpin family A member 10 n=1 Tax=Salvator merianae TaxID=96440 RepID=A0A8D0C5S2_SALMN
MKAGFLLVLFELSVGFCSLTGTEERSEVETQQVLLSSPMPDLFEGASTIRFSLHNFTRKNTDFGFNLYRKIALKHDNNVFFSPLSLSFALAAFLQASKGETYSQIVRSLNLHLLDDHDNQFPFLFQQLRDNITKNEELVLLQDSFSFIQKDFQIKNYFHNWSKQYFDMEILPVDFQNSTLAKNIINQHIKQKTKGKIPVLFDEVDKFATIIMVNYILFKGKWLQPFPNKGTELETFYIDNYKTVQVPMMFKTDRVASTYDTNLRCIVLKLPYQGNAYMLVVIPFRDSDYMSLEDHLTNELVEFWLKTMKTRKMDIFFPKFKLDQKYYMDQLLQDLGIKDLFSSKADLSHLTDQKNVKVSQMLQRAVIEVDERGTEAAAASGSEIIAYSMPPIIRVNRPFLFMIFDGSVNALLFMGRVTNPTEL